MTVTHTADVGSRADLYRIGAPAKHATYRTNDGRYRADVVENVSNGAYSLYTRCPDSVETRQRYVNDANETFDSFPTFLDADRRARSFIAINESGVAR